MTDDDVLATHIGQHAGRNFTGESTRIFRGSILGAKLNNAIVDSRSNVGQINTGRTYDHIGTALGRQSSPQGTDQGAISGAVTVELPVSGHERPPI